MPGFIGLPLLCVQQASEIVKNMSMQRDEKAQVVKITIRESLDFCKLLTPSAGERGGGLRDTRRSPNSSCGAAIAIQRGFLTPSSVVCVLPIIHIQLQEKDGWFPRKSQTHKSTEEFQSSMLFIFIFGYLISYLSLTSIYLTAQSPEWKEKNYFWC